jgi:hypothetical protein
MSNMFVAQSAHGAAKRALFIDGKFAKHGRRGTEKTIGITAA